MARGGRRTYVRDSRGRFASTPGGGAQAKGGTLSARSSLKKSRSKLASKDSADQSLRGTLSRRSQKGAVTRGSKVLKEAKASSRARLAVGGPANTIAKRKGLNPKTQKVAKSLKLSQSQRFAAKRAKDAFNDDTLLLNGRLAKGYKEGVQAVQKKFGVDNRIATKVLMKYGHRMGTSDIQYVDPAKAKKSIKAIRATTKVGGPLGGQKTGKSLGTRAIGTIAKRRSATEPKKQVTMGPRQVAGARKRASETTEAFSKRKLSAVRSKLQDRQERYQRVSTSLNRRRGKLEGDDRRKAATEQRKLKIAIDKLKYAEQKYQTAVTRRQDERNWNISRYNRGKAPQNSRTALNKLGTMRRRVAFLKKQGMDYAYDKYGERYATKKLVEAKKSLGDAVKGVSGQNVRFRTKKQASVAQASRRKRMLESSVNKRTGWKAGGSLFGRGVSRQENLLTGKADKVSGARLQPVRRKRKP